MFLPPRCVSVLSVPSRGPGNGRLISSAAAPLFSNLFHTTRALWPLVLEEAEVWGGSWAPPRFTREGLIDWIRLPSAPLFPNCGAFIFPICLHVTLGPSSGTSLIA